MTSVRSGTLASPNPLKTEDKLAAVWIIASAGSTSRSVSRSWSMEPISLWQGRSSICRIPESAERPEIKEFVDYYMKNGEKLTQGEVRSAAGKAYAYNLDQFAKKAKGTSLAVKTRWV